MQEEWKDIPKFKGLYQINNLGQIARIKQNKGVFLGRKILSLQVGKGGYCVCNLSKNHKRTPTYPHRLVAELFIPNPKNLSYVIHVNKDRRDNRIDNLAWSASREIVSDINVNTIKNLSSSFIRAKCNLDKITPKTFSMLRFEIEKLLETLLDKIEKYR